MDATDRCDMCGARATTEVVLKPGPLLFCDHHWREVASVLIPLAIPLLLEPVGQAWGK